MTMHETMQGARMSLRRALALHSQAAPLRERVALLLASKGASAPALLLATAQHFELRGAFYARVGRECEQFDCESNARELRRCAALLSEV